MNSNFTSKETYLFNINSMFLLWYEKMNYHILKDYNLIYLFDKFRS